MSKLYKSLLKEYGINKNTALSFCYKLGISPFNSSKEKIILFNTALTAWKKNNPVLATVKQNIARQINLNTVKGTRLKLGLPVRNQRTHCNANTAKKLNIRLSKYD